MKKLITALLMALGLTLGAAALPAPATAAVQAQPAQRTHPGIAVTGTCVGKLYVPTWGVTNDPAYPGVDAKVVTQSIATDPTLVGKVLTDAEGASATSAGVQPGDSVTLTIEVQFDNHADGDLVSNSGTYTAPTEPCKTPELVTKRASFSVTAYCNGVYVESTHNAKVTKTALGGGRFRFAGKAKVVDHVQALFDNGTTTRVIVRHVKRTGCHDAS